MKKVLVTGATGFIGKVCLPLLLKNGYEVHAVSSKNDQTQRGNVCWHRANLHDTKDVESMISKIQPTHLLHLAWYTEHKKYWASLENHDWVQASFALVQAFRKYGGRKSLIAGTCAEYDWSQGVCSEDITPLLPASLYGACRNELRQKIEVFSKDTGLSSAWGRIFFTYGPSEHPNRLVSSVISSLLQGKMIPCSDGSQQRDFLFVEDVASAFVAILENDFEGAINIGSGTAIRVRDVISAISNKIGRDDLVEFAKLPLPANEPALLVADVKKLKERIGWSAEYDLSRGLDKTIQWWRDYLKVI